MIDFEPALSRGKSCGWSSTSLCFVGRESGPRVGWLVKGVGPYGSSRVGKVDGQGRYVSSSMYRAVRNEAIAEIKAAISER